jgi:hypothetical protein
VAAHRAELATPAVGLAELASGFVRTSVDDAWSGTELPTAGKKEEAETPRC